MLMREHCWQIVQPLESIYDRISPEVILRPVTIGRAATPALLHHAMKHFGCSFHSSNDWVAQNRPAVTPWIAPHALARPDIAANVPRAAPNLGHNSLALSNRGNRSTSVDHLTFVLQDLLSGESW